MGCNVGSKLFKGEEGVVVYMYMYMYRGSKPFKADEGFLCACVEAFNGWVVMYSSGHKKVYVFDYAVAVVRSAVRTVRYYRRTVRLRPYLSI